MPTRRYYVNGAPTLTTSGAINTSVTSVTVATTFTGYPTQFPYFACLDKGTASAEIVSVTNVVGSVATIVRAQDGTAAVSHPAGATIDFVVVAKDYDEANAHTSASAGVHGISGSVVGTTDSQTLTNKSLTNPTMTGTATAAAVNASGAVSAASLTVSGAASAGSLSVSGAAAFSTGPTLNTIPLALPTGCWIGFCGPAAPTGYLLCQGQAISRTTYAALYTAIGNAFGAGDGSTTFNIPDFRGKFVAGLHTGDSDFNVNGTSGGAKTHTHPLSSNGQAQIAGNALGTKINGAVVTTASFSTSEGSGVTNVSPDNPSTRGTPLAGATDASSGIAVPYVTTNFIIKT